VDRWNSDCELVLEINLFPENVPKSFHKCSTKITSYINPPAVMEISDNNYTGLEVNFVEFIFKRLNLMAQSIVSPNTKDSYYRMFMQTVGQLEPSSSDISIGFPFCIRILFKLLGTIPYVHTTVLCYVPCPNSALRWKSIHKIFSSLVWKWFIAAAILALIIIRLLGKYEMRHHVRESTNYKTIMYCIYNVWAVITGVSVPQKTITLSLRIFFIDWVWYSAAMTNVNQAYFIGLLVNPGFEKSITTLNYLI
jgi:hypothetical protein